MNFPGSPPDGGQQAVNLNAMFVYALYNKIAQNIYIGQTSNIEKRLLSHNRKKGNHFTAKTKGQWVVIYQERVKTRQEALKREKQLKSYQGRQFIKSLIPR